MASQMARFFSSYGLYGVIFHLFHYLYTPHFSIPFIHWQIVRWLSYAGHCTQYYTKYGGGHLLETLILLLPVVGLLDHTKGEGGDRGWRGWTASLTWWTWVSVNSRSWWWTQRPGVLQSMGWQRVRHDWVTELHWSPCQKKTLFLKHISCSF